MIYRADNTPFSKLIELDEVTRTDEPTIRIVRPRDLTVPHVKVAEEALDYIKNVKPIPGKTIILVLAMTAGEYYGCNRNGDAWSERPLTVGKTQITADDVLPRHYKTFETNARVFRHHVNKDPEKRIGDVVRAFYNWPMHRVELLLALDNARAEEAVQEVESGKFPAVSMGCKIKHDVCSICGHPAPNRAAYCDHAKYELTRYRPDGKQVFVWNPSPTFFDISIVRRPADRVGFMMKKVADHVPEIRSSAEMGERIEALTHKAAMAKKLSVINKIVNGDIAAAREDNGDLNVVKDFADRVARPAASTMPAIDDTLIRELLKHRPAEVLATLSSLGIFLTTPEFIKYFVWKADPTLHIPEEVLQRAVDMQQDVFEALAKNPEIIEEIENTGILNLTPDKINPALANRLSSLCEKRSQADEFLQARLVGQILKTAAGTRGRLTLPGTFPWETTPSTPADINAAKSYGGRYLEPGQGYWDQLNVADPHTGQVHATTRGAAIRGHQLWRREKWLMPIRNLFGTGATLSAAQKFVGQPNIPMTPYQRRAWAYSRPWQTTEGEEIAPGTELKTGSHEPDLKSTIIRLAHDGMFGSPHQKVGSCSSAAAPLENATLADVVNWVGTVICP